MSPATELEISYIAFSTPNKDKTDMWEIEGIPGVRVTIWLYDRQERGGVYLVDVEADTIQLHVLKSFLTGPGRTYAETVFFETKELEPSVHPGIQNLVKTYVNAYWMSSVERAI
jgi:hypothetical protein